MSSIPESILTGDQAITVESFTELNSKLGAQWEASLYNPAVGAGLNLYIALEVGSHKLLLKDLKIQFTGIEIDYTLFVNPIYSGGSSIAIYNLYESTKLTSGVAIYGAPTVTDEGTQISPTIHSMGSTAAGSSTQAVNILNTTGVERVLSPNTKYLFKLNNNDTSSIKVSALATWYEGPFSTDRKRKTGGGF